MNFKLDDLPSWEGLMPKEILEFVAPVPRRVRLAFITNAEVEVWASFPVEVLQEKPDGSGELVEVIDPEMRDVLVAFGSGQFETEFTTHGTTYVRVLAPDETTIFVKGFAPDMRVAESDEEIYTTIEPRERRNTEFDRMVMWTKLNEARRERQFAEAMAALQAKAEVPEPAPAPGPEPDPKPAEGGGDGA